MKVHLFSFAFGIQVGLQKAHNIVQNMIIPHKYKKKINSILLENIIIALGKAMKEKEKP